MSNNKIAHVLIRHSAWYTHSNSVVRLRARAIRSVFLLVNSIRVSGILPYLARLSHCLLHWIWGSTKPEFHPTPRFTAEFYCHISYNQPLVDLKFISTHRHNLNFHLTNDKVPSTSSLSSAATQLTYENLCCFHEESSAENRTQEYGKNNGLTFHHTVRNLQNVRAVLGNDPLRPSYVLDMW
jgi:hypothetical protein